MNKIYILSHKRSFECGHEDYKIIGSFFSKKEALKIWDEYKNLKGFKKYLDGFYIQECIIDVIDRKELNELIKSLQKKNI